MTLNSHFYWTYIFYISIFIDTNDVNSDSSFVPPFVYAVLGSSHTLAVGTVAACSLLIAETFGEELLKTDPNLYLHLIFTSAFVTGVFQFALGFFRLFILFLLCQIFFLSSKDQIYVLNKTRVCKCHA